MLTVREARTDEIPVFRPEYTTAGFILEEDGQKVGQLFLSRFAGQVFGHNTECHSTDQKGAAMLWLRARRQVRQWGIKEVWIHFDGTEPQNVVHFWENLGFRPQMVMYRGEV